MTSVLLALFALVAMTLGGAVLAYCVLSLMERADAEGEIGAIQPDDEGEDDEHQ